MLLHSVLGFPPRKLLGCYEARLVHIVLRRRDWALSHTRRTNLEVMSKANTAINPFARPGVSLSSKRILSSYNFL
jgi:hypothetical protein